MKVCFPVYNRKGLSGVVLANASLDAFYMPQSNLNGLTEAFRHITTLMLPIHTCSAYSQNGPLAPALGDFGSFLRLFPNLTHLRLNGFPAPDSFDTTTEWLKKAQEALASSPIRRLDLGKLHMQREAFVTFLSTFKALEHLELHRVCIEFALCAHLDNSIY
jgi:hypothetical protein